MKKIFLSPPSLFVYLGIGLLLALTFDLWRCHSKYLYFTTELGLALLCGFLYVLVFRGRSWGEAFEPDDEVPRTGWKIRTAAFLAYIGLATGVLALVWIGMGAVQDLNWRVWFKSGTWYLYYVFIFAVNVVLMRHRLSRLDYRALAASVLVLTLLLTAYEVILLSQGTGWRYNHTVIGWVLGVPVDNILFIYPVAPALCMALYSIVTRHLNDLKAFWATMAILAPATIVVELIGIYPLDLWQIFNDRSVWPMGKTNFEEFFYYILFAASALLLYLWFERNLAPAPGVRRAADTP